MAENVVNWKKEWEEKEEGEKYMRITDVLNMTVVVSGVEFKEGTSRDNVPLTFVYLTTDKGKVKTASKPIVKAAKSKILPAIQGGNSVRVTIKSKLNSKGTYYYFVPPE